MAKVGTAPAGWTWENFEATAAEVGSWVWGTAQGAWNEKASINQIITDAVIGMIPLVGDATAVRDLAAVTFGLVDQPTKRDDKWQWILLVVLLFALIPVVGGVIKGVGRLSLRSAMIAEKLTGAARLVHMEQAAKECIEFLNRVGAGKAEAWFKNLNVADHQAALVQKFDDLARTMNDVLVTVERRMGHVLPASMLQRINGLKNGMDQLAVLARKMIPKALKDLHATLTELQQFIRSGGETTSRVTAHTAVAGERAVVTHADELRLIEGAQAARSARGGWAKNPAQKRFIDAKGLYKHEPGYPNLMAYSETVNGVKVYPNVTTYAGKIANRTLDKGEQVFRVFGPKGVTHGYQLPVDAFAGGNPARASKFWGMGGMPKNGKEWREYSGAVLDEWNHDGFIAVGTVEESGKVKACTGKIAEQYGEKIPGQYLPGGGKQAMIDTPADLAEQINAVAAQVVQDGKARTFSSGGYSWEIKPTGWKDVNGVHGYDVATRTAGVQTAKLGAREQASKER